MSIGTLGFTLLFIPVFLLWWKIPGRYKWILLLITNIIFYSTFGIIYLPILFINTIVSYIFGSLIEKYKKKSFLVIGIILCLLSLIVCKYTNFIIDGINLFGNNIEHISILLPIGISFYTFEMLSYMIDIYRNKIKAERRIGYYFCYVSFFPTITSGPIKRYDEFSKQLINAGGAQFNYDKAMYSTKLALWGLFKKLAVADVFAKYVNTVYNNLNTTTGFALLAVIFMYSIQIYADFSGYSDMARGVAGLLGFDVNKNFDTPYFSTTIKEFWSKWHISLSNWLRDYIYIPLGGNRKGNTRKYINLIITFFISGLWHGSSINFIIWGLLYALLEIVESVLHINKRDKKDFIWLLRCLVIFILVSLIWVLFRANTISDAIYLFTHMFDGITNPINYIVLGIYKMGISKTDIFNIVLAVIILFVYEILSQFVNPIEKLHNRSRITEYIVYAMLIMILIYLCPMNAQTQFVYFNF